MHEKMDFIYIGGMPVRSGRLRAGKDVEAPAECSEVEVTSPAQEEQFGEVWYGFYTK